MNKTHKTRKESVEDLKQRLVELFGYDKEFTKGWKELGEEVGGIALRTIKYQIENNLVPSGFMTIIQKAQPKEGGGWQSAIFKINKPKEDEIKPTILPFISENSYSELTNDLKKLMEMPKKIQQLEEENRRLKGVEEENRQLKIKMAELHSQIRQITNG
jgi:hypothetical protein